MEEDGSLEQAARAWEVKAIVAEIWTVPNLVSYGPAAMSNQCP